MTVEPLKSESWYPSDTICQIVALIGAALADIDSLLRYSFAAFLGGFLVAWLFIAILSTVLSLLVSKKKHPAAHGWFFMGVAIAVSILMYFIQHQKV
ncbi:MAG TPA: hypothetical protein VIJ79_17150 [Acidobacteriaceae bacterium]